MLEEVTSNDIKAYNGQHQHKYTQAPRRSLDKFCGTARAILADEDTHNLIGEQFAEQETERSGCHRASNGHPQCFQHTVVGTRTVVVSHDGLHTLREAHNHHRKEEGHTVGDAVGTDREVAAIYAERIVDKDYHHAGTRHNHKGRHTHGDDVLDNIPMEAERLATETQEARLVGEVNPLHHNSQQLSNDRSPRRASDTPFEPKDKDSIENGVEYDGYSLM